MVFGYGKLKQPELLCVVKEFQPALKCCNLNCIFETTGACAWLIKKKELLGKRERDLPSQ